MQLLSIYDLCENFSYLLKRILLSWQAIHVIIFFCLDCILFYFIYNFVSLTALFRPVVLAIFKGNLRGGIQYNKLVNQNGLYIGLK